MFVFFIVNIELVHMLGGSFGGSIMSVKAPSFCQVILDMSSKLSLQTWSGTSYATMGIVIETVLK